MARGTHKCPKCDRTFSMPAHVARHMNAMHGARRGRKGKSLRASTRGPKGARRVGRPVGSTNASAGGATRVIREMKAYYRELTQRRDSLDAQIGGLESVMSVMGAVPVRSSMGRRRGRRRVGRPRMSSGLRVVGV